MKTWFEKPAIEKPLLSEEAPEDVPEIGTFPSAAKPQPTCARSIGSLNWYLCCSSSLALIMSVPFMPEATPVLFIAAVWLATILSIVHHIVEESLPEEKWISSPGAGFSSAYDIAFRADGAGICSACAAFYVCFWPRLGMATQIALMVTSAVLGFLSRNFKILLYIVASVGVAVAQPDVVGVVATVANQSLAFLLIGASIHLGRWCGPLHLWSWHILGGVFLFLGARALVAVGKQWVWEGRP